MAVIVVGGSASKVGKTALVCGLLAALSELEWTAVKIASHAHAGISPVYEENSPGQGTDTARYLVAGARRAILLTADDENLAERLSELTARLDAGSHLLFESNRVLRHLRPGLTLAIGDSAGSAQKPSFSLVLGSADAVVVHAECDGVTECEKPVFALARFECVSAPMRAWLQEKLRVQARSAAAIE